MVAPADDAHDTVDFEAPEEHVAFDLMEEAETTAQPVDGQGSVPPADSGEVFQDVAADTAETVAAADLNEMMEDVGDEVFQVQSEQPEIESPADEVPAGEPFPDEPSAVHEVSPPELDPEHSKTTPINVASVMAADDAEEDGFEMDDDDISNAQTQDLHEPEVTPEREPELEPAPTPEPTSEPAPVAAEAQASTEHEKMAPQTEAGLSDADVDRIARRLLELAGDRIERIAWDVIPDMAEIVVRERVREIEDSTRSEAN
jgi:hypothetical protein